MFNGEEERDNFHKSQKSTLDLVIIMMKMIILVALILPHNFSVFWTDLLNRKVRSQMEILTFCIFDVKLVAQWRFRRWPRLEADPSICCRIRQECHWESSWLRIWAESGYSGVSSAERHGASPRNHSGLFAAIKQTANGLIRGPRTACLEPPWGRIRIHRPSN